MYSLPWKRLFVALLALAIATGTARADEQIFSKILPSSAWVLVPVGEDFSIGTGCVVDVEQRLVATCSHVLMGQQQAAVYFPLYENDRLVTDTGAYLRGNRHIRARVLA